MSDQRVYNFSAGPSMLPLSALERAGSEITNYRGSGMSVMEMSHRSKIFMQIFAETQEKLRRLMNGNYCTLSARFSDAVACYHTLIIVSPLSPSDLQSCKTYESSNIVDYLTHIRTYSDLDDLGADYIRDTDTGAWRRQYLLPPAK